MLSKIVFIDRTAFNIAIIYLNNVIYIQKSKLFICDGQVYPQL